MSNSRKSIKYIINETCKDIETTENYYISSTDETRKNATDSYENAINLDVIEEIIEYKISI